MFLQSSSNIMIVILVFAGILMLFAAFIVLIIYKYQRNRYQYLQTLDELKLSYESTLLQSQVEIQEQTLKHIAAEIHDNIGQQLTLAKLQLNSLHLQPHPALTIGKSVGILTQAIQSLSELSRHLGTPLLQDNGLIAAIAADVQKLNASGRYQAALNIAGQEVLLDANTELLLFRIVQESIANFVKHAQATTLHINLHYDKAQLQLQVVDNGCGFNPQQTEAGAGLSNIRKRTRLLKGQCEIHSEPGNTTITIIIPLHDNNT